VRAGSAQTGGVSGLEWAVASICAAVVGVAGVVFAGAWVATRFAGGRVDVDLGAWLSALIALGSDPGDPAAAWGSRATGIPGPVPYWVCTGFAAVVAVAMGCALWRLWRRLSPPDRVRFGVDTDARQARSGDLHSLVVASELPPAGRLLLGEMAPHGPLLATEDRDRHPLSGRKGRRQGSRGSVALIGPTQAGKTALLSSGMIGWDGPVIALSVKRDLYDVTASARSTRGEVAVFDPGASTGLPTARWTPLRGVATASGALRAGRALAAAIPTSGVQGGDYWAQQGEMFVSAYMAVAGLSVRLDTTPDGSPRERLTIETLTAWAFRSAGITDPTINELVHSGLECGDLETQRLAEAAALKLTALHNEDPRIRASIYATGRMAFEAWGEPSVAHSASMDARDFYNSDEVWDRRPRFVDLDWLVGGPEAPGNTLYLVAPDTEFKRLAPVLGGMLGDFREQLHGWDIEGRRLSKPLLVVIDEAAQLELAWLPEEVSTIAGLGGMFVTCWQSKAQIDHRYGTLADAVLGGHRSKIVFTGVDDPATLTWLRTVAGTEQVARRSWSAEMSGGRRTVSESSQREDLIAPHVVRQMLPGEAVLIHGTLPPVHLRSLRWWENKTLRALVPVGEDGRPVAPAGGTCPVSDEAPIPGEAGLDRAGRDEPIQHLPAAVGPRPPAESLATLPPAQHQDHETGGPVPEAMAPGPESDGPNQGADAHRRNRMAGACEVCEGWVLLGTGVAVCHDTRDAVICFSCFEETSPGMSA
jgi:type IV secretion system protein VirD4